MIKYLADSDKKIINHELELKKIFDQNILKKGIFLDN